MVERPIDNRWKNFRQPEKSLPASIYLCAFQSFNISLCCETAGFDWVCEMNLSNKSLSMDVFLMWAWLLHLTQNKQFHTQKKWCYTTPTRQKSLGVILKQNLGVLTSTVGNSFTMLAHIYSITMFQMVTNGQADRVHTYLQPFLQKFTALRGSNPRFFGSVVHCSRN
jgi:hypothetical protein